MQSYQAEKIGPECRAAEIAGIYGAGQQKGGAVQNGDPRGPLEVPHKTLTDGWDVNIPSDTTQGFQDSAVTGLRVQQRHERLDTARKRAVPGD